MGKKKSLTELRELLLDSKTPPMDALEMAKIFQADDPRALKKVMRKILKNKKILK